MKSLLSLLCISLILIVAISAYPTKNHQKQEHHEKQDENLFPLDRTRPSSPRKGFGSENVGGPQIYFRESKSIHNPYHHWPVYAVRARADDDDDEDDTDSEEAEDDLEEGSDEEDFAFDTPSWDYLFPKSETGPYAQRTHEENNAEAAHNWRGRSGKWKSWNEDWEPSGPGPVYVVRSPKSRPPQWQHPWKHESTSSRVSPWERNPQWEWASLRPHEPSRRNWNGGDRWGHWDEHHQGPRRIKTFSPQHWKNDHARGPGHYNWGYY